MLWLKVMKIVVFMLSVGCIHLMGSSYGWRGVIVMMVYAVLTVMWFGLDNIIHGRRR